MFTTLSNAHARRNRRKWPLSVLQNNFQFYNHLLNAAADLQRRLADAQQDLQCNRKAIGKFSRRSATQQA